MDILKFVRSLFLQGSSFHCNTTQVIGSSIVCISISNSRSSKKDGDTYVCSCQNTRLGRIREDPNLKETSSSKEMEDVFAKMKINDDYTLGWFLLTLDPG